MSMRDYGVDNYGLLLSDNIMRYLASKICNDYSDEEYKDDEWSFIDRVVGKLGVEYISEFSGNATKISDDGTDDWISQDSYESFSSDVIFCIPLRKYPTLFKAAYRNIEEIIEELKGSVGEYLPSDFDRRNNIRHITGTYFG